MKKDHAAIPRPTPASTEPETEEIRAAVKSALRTARWLDPKGGSFYSAEEHRFSIISQLEWALLALGDPEGSEERVKDATYRSHHMGRAEGESLLPKDDDEPPAADLLTKARGLLDRWLSGPSTGRGLVGKDTETFLKETAGR